jgi:hypothetical protein
MCSPGSKRWPVPRSHSMISRSGPPWLNMIFSSFTSRWHTPATCRNDRAEHSRSMVPTISVSGRKPSGPLTRSSTVPPVQSSIVKNISASVSSTSSSRTMFGCSIPRSSAISLRSPSSSLMLDLVMHFMATVRFDILSVALQTSPYAPLPSTDAFV